MTNTIQQSPLVAARVLVGVYAALSIATVAAIAVLQAVAPDLAGPAAWIRGTIVAATSILMLVFANQAVRGHRRALLRWRIVAAVMIVAIAVIVSIPGLIPLWMRLEQVLCGVLLIGVAALVFRRTHP
ncbi:hypothetical protein [Leifsonia sp. NPDC058230]|uniref:hypothetical protein n=1 Tax=Leifsonia sp. NPDC058230 TaxID=3346391 RepID=UPI0036DC93C2